MKIGCHIILLIAGFFCSAQDTLVFRIISCKGDVTVDEKPAEPGTKVYSNSKILRVGNDSYADVLTEGGYTYKFKRSESSVAKIQNEIYRKKHRPRATGAIENSIGPFELLTVPAHNNSYLMGDSIFLQWKENYKVGPPFTLTVENLSGDLIYDTTINQNMFLLDMTSMMKKEMDVIGKVQNASHESVDFLIRKLHDQVRTDVEFDLERIAETDPILKLIITMAIYDINELYYDQCSYLYKLQQLEKSGKPIQNSYYTRLIKLLNEGRNVTLTYDPF